MLPATARLIPHPLAPSHWFDVRCIHQNAATMATLGGLRSEESSQQWMTENLAHWRQHGFGMCPWSLRESGQFVGLGGLRHLHLDGITEVEVGYGLLPEYWGIGLSTELARECINHAFTELRLPSIVALTLTDNRASQRVMEKAGLTFDHELIHAGLPHVLYRTHTWRTP